MSEPNELDPEDLARRLRGQIERVRSRMQEHREIMRAAGLLGARVAEETASWAPREAAPEDPAPNEPSLKPG